MVSCFGSENYLECWNFPKGLFINDVMQLGGGGGSRNTGGKDVTFLGVDKILTRGVKKSEEIPIISFFPIGNILFICLYLSKPDHKMA